MIFDVFENLLWRQGLVASKADWSRNGSKGERAFLHYQLKHIRTFLEKLFCSGCEEFVVLAVLSLRVIHL